MPTYQELARRPHSIRSHDPDDYRDAWEQAEGNREHEAGVRSAFERIESGRFAPMVEHGHKMFARLDPDEQRDFAAQNPGLMDWIAVYGLIQHLRRFEEFL